MKCSNGKWLLELCTTCWRASSPHRQTTGLAPVKLESFLHLIGQIRTSSNWKLFSNRPIQCLNAKFRPMTHTSTSQDEQHNRERTRRLSRPLLHLVWPWPPVVTATEKQQKENKINTKLYVTQVSNFCFWNDVYQPTTLILIFFIKDQGILFLKQ